MELELQSSDWVGAKAMIGTDPSNESAKRDCICGACLVYELDVCTDTLKKQAIGPRLKIDISPSATHTIPARRTVIHPKESSEFVLFICHGWVARSIIAPDGHRQIVSFLLPGDIISAATLFGPMSGYSVEAITEVVYRKFKQPELKAALFEHPGLMEKLWLTWLNERVEADRLAVNISHKGADKRVAWLILNLAKRFTNQKAVDGQRFDFPLRQRHIADATGLTDVYVGKVLSDFQRTGLIEISNRSLRIIDKDKLRYIALWQ